MTNEVATKAVRVANPNGLHARPADLFARTASQFKAEINVVKDGRRVDGKSILGILTLVAEQGTELLIEAHGVDARDALVALVRLIEEDVVEDEQLSES